MGQAAHEVIAFQHLCPVLDLTICCQLFKLMTRALALAQKAEGGSRQQRMLAQWPALAGQGISQTVFTLEPCALRAPHVHPRGTGLLYLISGEPFKYLLIQSGLHCFS